MAAASAVVLALKAPRARKKPDTNRINIFRDPDDRKPPPQSSMLLHQQQQPQPCLNNTVTDSSPMIQHLVIDPFEEIKPFTLVKTTTATIHNDDPFEEKPFNQLHYHSPAAMEGEDDDEDDLVECLSKTKTPQPLRRKRDQQRQPRKENNQRKKQHSKKSDGNDEEKQQKMRVIRIRISDPYATDDDSSSSDEEEGAKESAAISKRKRQILHIMKIPFLSPPPPPPCTPLLLKNDNDDHEKQELEKEASCLEGKGKERRPTRRTRARKNNDVKKRAGKKKGGPISSPTCSTDRHKGEQNQGETGMMESIAWPALRCIDVPGPVPENLDTLMYDATLLINFYEGLPDY